MIQAIHQRRKDRARKLLTMPLCFFPAKQLKRTRPRLTTAAVLAVEHLINAYAAPVHIPKTLSFDLKSTRRAWSSMLAISIRLKW
jgi:hypothetical protein